MSAGPFVNYLSEIFIYYFSHIFVININHVTVLQFVIAMHSGTAYIHGTYVSKTH